MIQALGATLNVMALLLVNMIGYAVGIKGAGHVAGGIFLDREGQLAVAYSFMFVFSGVQVTNFGTGVVPAFALSNYTSLQ